MKNIDTYLEDYEGWIDSIKEVEPTNELIVNYDFDREIIDTEDYFFIRSDQETSDGEITLHNYELFVWIRKALCCIISGIHKTGDGSKPLKKWVF